MLSVVFGESQQHMSLSALHRRLMHKANRVFGLRASKGQLRMAAELRSALLARRDNCLVGDVELPFDNHGLQAENQVPHWMFAIRDTLAVNCARALALITAHESFLEKARQELSENDLSKAGDIAKLKYIEGGLQEAMRLWPTTPVLARENLRRDRLGDDEIASGSQVVTFTQYLHRDRNETPDADRFSPERWYAGRINPQFNHMSNGKQGCAGRNLALFLGTAALANLISRGYVLDSPKFDPRQSVPATFNYFRLCFTQTSVGA
jgi:cytochrome P450